MIAAPAGKRIVVIDGVSCAPEEARVSVFDRGFLYGDSVFETVRTYAGKPFELDEHLRRLELSAASMGIAMPLSLDALAAEIKAALAAAANPESYVRVMLTRGSGPLGLDPDLASAPLRVVMVQPLTLPAAALYQRGLSAHCVTTVRAADATDSAKLGNYLASVLALRRARAAGAEEALVVNRDGLVVEGTTANVFAVQGEHLLTPPLAAGVLAGITRRLVIEVAAELGLTVEERALAPTELQRVDEIFLSSSVRELMPIVTVDGKPIGTGKPGSVTRRLHTAFRKKVGTAERLPWISQP